MSETKEYLEKLNEVAIRLKSYFDKVTVNENGVNSFINALKDDFHLLISLGKKLSFSELIGDIKRDSSSWIKQQDKQFDKFYWQEGYGAFSVGQTEDESVIEYIKKQKGHRKNKDYKTEFR